MTPRDEEEIAKRRGAGWHSPSCWDDIGLLLARCHEQRRLMERMGEALTAAYRAITDRHGYGQHRDNPLPTQIRSILTAYDAVKGESDDPPA